MPNPLRQPKPAKEQCIYNGKFYFADANARLAEGALGSKIYVTTEFLWVTDELAIPVGSIQDAQIIEKGWLPKRRALAITYENPVSSEDEALFLCKPDAFAIGLYRVAPLQELLGWIEQARQNAPAGDPVVHSASETPKVSGNDFTFTIRGDAQPADECEVCGGKPAYYVTYSYLVSVLLLSYRSKARRRVHCAKHNLIYGVPHYLVTALVGWCGIGIFAYPFMAFGTARSMTPSLGKATYVLGLLPTLALGGLIAWWLLA